MVQGWFPSAGCMPLLPTTHVRKRWHRRVLDRLQGLRYRELFLLSGLLLGLCAGLAAALVWWLGCPPLAELVFSRCAPSPSARPSSDDVILNTGSPLPPGSVVSGLRVADGKAVEPGRGHTVGAVKLESGRSGPAELKLVTDQAAPAPVDEHEAREDVLFGVEPGLRGKYRRAEETETFECRDERGVALRLPVEKLNDDYCDCADGSDEPGTSACQGNHKFFCAEAGHKLPGKLRGGEAKSGRRRIEWVWSSSVNDGICDCCDGSDESTSGVECRNWCDKAG